MLKREISFNMYKAPKCKDVEKKVLISLEELDDFYLQKIQGLITSKR
jgi:hypothetical protein